MAHLPYDTGRVKYAIEKHLLLGADRQTLLQHVPNTANPVSTHQPMLLVGACGVHSKIRASGSDMIEYWCHDTNVRILRYTWHITEFVRRT